MNKILHKLLLEAIDIDNELKKTSFYQKYPKFKSQGKIIDLQYLDWYKAKLIKDVILNDEKFNGAIGSGEYYIYTYYKFLKNLCDQSVNKQATTSVNIERGLSKIDSLLGDLGVSSQSISKPLDVDKSATYRNVNGVDLEDGMKLHITYSYDKKNYTDEFTFNYGKNTLVGNKGENIELPSPLITTNKIYRTNIKNKLFKMPEQKNVIFNKLQVLDTKHTALGGECDLLNDFYDFIKIVISSN